MPNNDLISRSALIERFENLKDNPNNRLIDIVFLDGAMSVIDVAPAVDAEPVRHGRWEWKGGAAYCTAHKRKLSSHVYGYAYCPWCGAVMDKEE